MIPKSFLLIKQIRSRTPQINNLRTSISIFFQPCTFKTVKSVWYSLDIPPPFSSVQPNTKKEKKGKKFPPLATFIYIYISPPHSFTPRKKKWNWGKRERKKRFFFFEKTYLSSTDNAFILIVSKTTLIAYPDQCRGAHVWVANGAFAIAFIAQTTDCYPRLFAAHYQIALVDFFFVSHASSSKKKRWIAGWRPAMLGGGGGTYGWWRDIFVACSRWEFCGGFCCASWGELSWSEGRFAKWINLSAKRALVRFETFCSFIHQNAVHRARGFCPLADLGDLPIWLVRTPLGKNSHVMPHQPLS